MQFPALIDGKDGAYGVAFPDLPGCVATGSSEDEALANAAGALRDWIDSMADAGQPVAAPSDLEAVAVPEGSKLAFVSLSPSIARTGA